MKAIGILFILISAQCSLVAQVNYGTPPADLVPEKLEGIRQAIEVIHFPKINDPVKIDDKYYWKHITSIVSKEDDLKIVEFGAYLYYNDQWNLRRSYPLKELDKYFGTKKQELEQGQPYTWPQNWRVDNSLFGGWALWYFIGENKEGERVFGYATIHTTDNLLNEKL